MCVKQAVSSARSPLLFYYHRLNRYSFNALAGALDSNPDLAEWPVTLARTAEEIRTAATALLDQHGRIIVAFSVLTPQLGDLQHLAGQLRSDYGSRISIIAGGPHATADARNVLNSGVDIGIPR